MLRPGIHLTTSLPPAIVGAALSSVRYVRQHAELRHQHQSRARQLRKLLAAAGLPVMPSETHIVPVRIGCPVRAKQICDLLLAEHGIYVQPIKLTTQPFRGELSVFG
jgi:5-aminolevulinate synthase